MKKKIFFIIGIFIFGFLATFVIMKNRKETIKTSYAGAYGGKSRAPVEIAIDKNNPTSADISVTTDQCTTIKVKYRFLPEPESNSDWISLSCDQFIKQKLDVKNLNSEVHSIVFDIEMQTSNQNFVNSFEMQLKQKKSNKEQVEKMSDGSLVKVNPVNPIQE